jgi:hypothetical protein
MLKIRGEEKEMAIPQSNRIKPPKKMPQKTVLKDRLAEDISPLDSAMVRNLYAGAFNNNVIKLK